MIRLLHVEYFFVLADPSMGATPVMIGSTTLLKGVLYLLSKY